MATVPSGQKFHTVPNDVETSNLGSKLANSNREIYTMQDITDTVVGNVPPSTPMMYITILNQSGTNAPTTSDIVFDFLPTTVNRNSAGNYTFLFPTGTFTAKTIANIYCQGTNPNGLIGVVGMTLNWNYDRIDIVTQDPSVGNPSDDYLAGATLSIQVFP